MQLLLDVKCNYACNMYVFAVHFFIVHLQCEWVLLPDDIFKFQRQEWMLIKTRVQKYTNWKTGLENGPRSFLGHLYKCYSCFISYNHSDDLFAY